MLHLPSGHIQLPVKSRGIFSTVYSRTWIWLCSQLPSWIHNSDVGVEEQSKQVKYFLVCSEKKDDVAEMFLTLVNTKFAT